MSIFNAKSYTSYIKTYLANLPKNGRGEINRIAISLEIHGTLISQVLSGTRDFTPEQALKFCRYLGLPALETNYFVLLVQRDRAGTADLKSFYQGQLDSIKMEAQKLVNRIPEHRALTDYERSIFYSTWLYSAVRLFTSVQKGQSVDNVASRFGLSRAAATEILTFLERAELCEERDGLFTMASQHTHLPFGSPFLSRHHANWRMKAIQRSENLEQEEMMFTAPASLSRADFAILREQIIEFIKKATEAVKNSKAEDVACLNIDLFWIKK